MGEVLGRRPCAPLPCGWRWSMDLFVDVNRGVRVKERGFRQYS